MTKRKGSWMQTATGKQYFPLDPRPEDVCIEDIAHALSNTCRYNGHTRSFYSVAEHSVIVSQYVPPEFALHGLLHDAAEAYVGDMIRPLKYQPEFAFFSVAEELNASAINQRFNLEWTPEAEAAVKSIDNRILVDERDQIMASPPASWRLDGLVPLGATISGLSPVDAEQWFLCRFKELTSKEKK